MKALITALALLSFAAASPSGDRQRPNADHGTGGPCDRYGHTGPCDRYGHTGPCQADEEAYGPSPQG
jgi:hypothetical protein